MNNQNLISNVRSGRDRTAPRWARRTAISLAAAFAWVVGVAPCAYAASPAAGSHTMHIKAPTVAKVPTFDYQAALNGRSERPFSSAGDGSNSSRSLLTDGATLSRAVSASEVAAWQSELRQGGTNRIRGAWLHVWLGEVELARDEQPEVAKRHFREAQALAPKGSAPYGLAAYDSAVATFSEGAYAAAVREFQPLANMKTALQGYDVRNATYWMRHAVPLAEYHKVRARMGIPEPPRLDPLCAAAALAASLRSLNMPYDPKTVLANCRVTGEGSSLADVSDAAKKLGLTMYSVTADDKGLMSLPKPLVASVEHDHFVSVIRADRSGVSYLCSDCGAWPGGRVNLTWKQWHAMDGGPYGVIVRPDSPWNAVLRSLPSRSAGPAVSSEVRVAAATASPALESTKRLRPIRAGGLGLPLLRGTVYRFDLGYWVYCGWRFGSPPPPPNSQPPYDASGNGPNGSGPLGGDPVNLATAEEDYKVNDLRVYNPHGPDVYFGRVYRSLRNAGQGYKDGDNTYECNDFGLGWSLSYNVGVFASNYSDTSAKYIQFADGSQVQFTPPAVPTASAPVVHCQVAPSEPYLVDWTYDGSASGYFTITMADHTKLVTGDAGSTGFFQLASQVDISGNAIYFNYGSAAPGFAFPLLSSITDQPNGAGTKLLTVQRETDGSIASISDCYGRSVYYNVSQQPDIYQSPELDHVSQIVSSCTPNPPDRYVYGYTLSISQGQGDAQEFAMLHSVSVPSPTGTGYATAYINYDPNYNTVSSVVDANGNWHYYYSVDANGNLSNNTTYTKVVIKDRSGNTTYSYTVGFDSAMNLVYETDGAGNQIYGAGVTNTGETLLTDEDIIDANGDNVIYRDNYLNVTDVADTASQTGTHYTYSYSGFGLGQLTAVGLWGYQQVGTGQIWDEQATSQITAYATYDYYPNGALEDVNLPQPGTANQPFPSVAAAHYVYDALGNVTSVTTPGNNAAPTKTTTYNYTSDPGDAAHNVPAYSQAEALGQPLTATDGLGHVTHLRWDSQGQLVKRYDALGNETDFAYDVGNDLTSITFPRTGQTGLGNAMLVTSYLYPAGPATGATLYDESGNPVRQETVAYGPDGEVRGASGAADSTSYTYDALFRLSSFTDAGGHTTRYYYDQPGNLAAVTLPGYSGPAWPNISGPDSVTYPLYDTYGRPLKRIDGNGAATTYGYTANMLSTIAYSSAPNLNTTISRDPATGRITQVARGTSANASDTAVVTYGYDDRDEVTSTSTSYNGMPTRTIQYGYYPDGSRQSMTTPAGTFQYTYDAAGRPATMTNPFGESSSWQFKDNGWLGSQTLSNGVTTTFTRNAAGQITDARTTTAANALLSDFGSMTYDGASNLLSSAVSVPSAPAAYNGLTTYQYDSQDQLLQEQTRAGGTNGYAYDASGNPTTFRNATGLGYNADNQLVASGYGYDGDGSPTLYNNVGLSFDPEGNLSSYGSAMTAGYLDDGHRAWKQNASGQRTYFLYDGDTPVCEMDGAENVTAVNTFGADGLLSRTAGSASEFYTWDMQGNVSQSLDANANVIATSEFDAFGNGATTSAGIVDPFSGFGGQWGGYTDVETGLQLFTHRYYDSGAGRFITTDPIGFLGGANLYGYAGNNPVNFCDPLGMDWLDNTSNFFAGWGDTLTFGATKSLRAVIGEEYGVGDANQAVDYNSGWYTAGEVTGTVQETAMGGAEGFAAGGEKAAGMEFSHWIPNRFLKNSGNFIKNTFGRSKWNGNFVTKAEHALTDPYRYRFMPKAWKQMNKMYHPVIQQLMRVPTVYRGMAAGSAAGSAYMHFGHENPNAGKDGLNPQ